jgi:hypothetical protein
MIGKEIHQGVTKSAKSTMMKSTALENGFLSKSRMAV